LGQLGIDDGTSTVFYAIYVSSGWKTVSAGRKYTCGIKTDNTLYCWGDNTYGQLGIGESNEECQTKTIDGLTYKYCDFPREVKINYQNTTFNTVKVGDWKTFAIKSDNGTLFVWGRNVNGNEDWSKQYIPMAVSVNNTEIFPVDISFSENNACFTDNEYKTYCWWDNTEGKLGTNADINSDFLSLGDIYDSYPVKSRNNQLKFFNKISTGINFSCGIEYQTEKLFCWGESNNIGIENLSESFYNYALFINIKAKEIVLNRFSNEGFSRHHCLIDNYGHLYCWGDNSFGQVGNADSDSEYIQAREPIDIFKPFITKWYVEEGGSINININNAYHYRYDIDCQYDGLDFYADYKDMETNTE